MKAYKIIKSNIHREGLCAARKIKKGEKIIEYKGKKITQKQADENNKYGYKITYLFELNKKYLLDGENPPDHSTINRFRQKIVELAPSQVLAVVRLSGALSGS